MTEAEITDALAGIYPLEQAGPKTDEQLTLEAALWDRAGEPGLAEVLRAARDA